MNQKWLGSSCSKFLQNFSTAKRLGTIFMIGLAIGQRLCTWASTSKSQSLFFGQFLIKERTNFEIQLRRTWWSREFGVLCGPCQPNNPVRGGLGIPHKSINRDPPSLRKHICLVGGGPAHNNVWRAVLQDGEHSMVQRFLVGKQLVTRALVYAQNAQKITVRGWNPMQQHNIETSCTIHTMLQE